MSPSAIACKCVSITSKASSITVLQSPRQPPVGNRPVLMAVSCVPGSRSSRGCSEKTHGSVLCQLLTRKIYLFCLNTSSAGDVLTPADPLVGGISRKKMLQRIHGTMLYHMWSWEYRSKETQFLFSRLSKSLLP